MLFISRRKHGETEGLYGVVDTDDGVETMVRDTDLKRMVTVVGLDIKGVSLLNITEEDLPALREMNGREFMNAYIRIRLGIDPYQQPGIGTPKQAKLNAVMGVDIRTFKPFMMKISSITWREGSKATIRLSEYGYSICDYVLDSNTCCGSGITLVFDDKLLVSRYSFSTTKWSWVDTDGNGCGIKFDLREVECRDTAQAIYSGLRDVSQKIGSAIIDNPDRWNELGQIFLPF